MEQKIHNIQCLICDVDGVLTNGYIYLDTNGNETRAFHVHDGVGLKLLLSAGIEVAIITTTDNNIIDDRMEQIGIKHYFKGQVNKQSAFDSLKQDLNLPNEAFAYIGDDLPDIPIMQQVGFAATVANAQPQVQQMVDWQSQKPGGGGAVRELCDLILSTQSKTELALTGLLK